MLIEMTVKHGAAPPSIVESRGPFRLMDNRGRVLIYAETVDVLPVHFAARREHAGEQRYLIDVPEWPADYFPGMRGMTYTERN